MVGIALSLGRGERCEHPFELVGVVDTPDLGCTVDSFVQQRTDGVECTRVRRHCLRADAHASVVTDPGVDGEGARTTEVVVSRAARGWDRRVYGPRATDQVPVLVGVVAGWSSVAAQLARRFSASWDGEPGSAV